MRFLELYDMVSGDIGNDRRCLLLVNFHDMSAAEETGRETVRWAAVAAILAGWAQWDFWTKLKRFKMKKKGRGEDGGKSTSCVVLGVVIAECLCMECTGGDVSRQTAKQA
jgi:hypothetical protein